MPIPMPPGMTTRFVPSARGIARSVTIPRLPPRASSSSMKITAPPYLSERFRAFLNSRRTFRLPTPKNMLAKPEPVEYRKGTPVAPAMAFAMRVLPVPGGPSNRIPCGGYPPISLKFLNPWNRRRTSFVDETAAGCPRTSSKLTSYSPG